MTWPMGAFLQSGTTASSPHAYLSTWKYINPCFYLNHKCSLGIEEIPHSCLRSLSAVCLFVCLFVWCKRGGSELPCPRVWSETPPSRQWCRGMDSQWLCSVKEGVSPGDCVPATGSPWETRVTMQGTGHLGFPPERSRGGEALRPNPNNAITVNMI